MHLSGTLNGNEIWKSETLQQGSADSQSSSKQVGSWGIDLLHTCRQDVNCLHNEFPALLTPGTVTLP